MIQRLLQDEGIVSFTSTASSPTTTSHDREEIQSILLPLGTLSIHVMPMDLIPLDTYLITLLEYDGTLKDVDLIGISSEYVTMVAKSIVHVQDSTNMIIPRIQPHALC